jgi:hypothetical protein
MAQMRELLLGLEEEVGLGALTQNEKDVFFASYTEIYLVGGTAKSVDIKKHALLIGMAQPTFRRCLKALIGRGLLALAPNTKAGSYTIPIF